LHRWSLRFSFSHAPASEFCTLSLHDALPIYDEDVLALELGAHRVELLLHRLLALLLARHDEGPADVAVLVEALAVLDAEATRDRSEERRVGKGCRTRCGTRSRYRERRVGGEA